jgi:hypothetical protein
MPAHKMKFVVVKQQGAARRLRLRGVRAAAGTGLRARSFHIETRLWCRVLPPGEWNSSDRSPPRTRSNWPSLGRS